MRILIEHPIFQPYTAITGGTELFVRHAARALSARGHEVQIYASSDSALPCIKSTACSKQSLGKKKCADTKAWYGELGEAAAHFDAVILNTTMTSLRLLDPTHAKWYVKAVYFNHNGSTQFVTQRQGFALQSTVRYFRAHGGRAYYLSERNRGALAAEWVAPGRRAWALEERPAKNALARLANRAFLDGAPWDGSFFQGVYPDDAAPARASEGYLLAIGRDDPEKRLYKARQLAEKVNREIFVLTNEDHGFVMEALAGAEALLLPSRNETFSIVAFEAVCHGVPVSCIEVPPALEPFPYLAGAWGDWLATSVEERVGLQVEMRQEYSAEAMGKRLEDCFH